MALNGFTWWRSYCEVGEELSVKEQKEFYFAIVRFLMYDEDIEDKLTKNARMAFKLARPTMEKSRSRSESGRRGMESRYNKTLTNAQQTDNKTLTNAQPVTDTDTDTDTDTGRARAAACPKCGGPLDWTAVTKPGGRRGVRRMFYCSKCHEEVWI